MYEAQTYEAILSRMLQKALSINGNLDTREGSLVWCGDAPAAVELQNLYIALDTVLNETFADTATRPYLILRAAERGLKPQPASPAVLQLSITPTTLHLPMNTRFSIGELNYYVSADRGSGKYEITCETAGEAGNDYTGTVIPIEYVDGLETCSISAVVIPGEDEEDTEVFRQRYMDSLNAPSLRRQPCGLSGKGERHSRRGRCEGISGLEQRFEPGQADPAHGNRHLDQRPFRCVRGNQGVVECRVCGGSQ